MVPGGLGYHAWDWFAAPMQLCRRDAEGADGTSCVPVVLFRRQHQHDDPRSRSGNKDTTVRNPTVLSLCVGTILLCAPCRTWAQMAPLCPEPQQLKLLHDRRPLDLSNGCRLKVISPDAGPVRHAVEELRTAAARASRIAPTDDGSALITVGLLGDADFVPGEIAEALPAEGYVLKVADGRAWVLGTDARGTAYGCQTLIQLLRSGKPVPALQIRDWPDTVFRMAYVAGGDTLTEQVRRRIDMAAHYKLNMLVFENSAYFQLDDKQIAAGVQQVFDYCRAVGIEPIPELQSFGWAGHILSWEPLCVEAHPWKDRQYVFGNDDIAAFVTAPGMSLDVVNARFERGEGDSFTGWQQDDVGRTLFEDTGADGGRALRITRTTSGMSRAWQTFACLPNQRYTLDVDVRVQPEGDVYAYYEVYYGSTGVYVASSAIGDGNEVDWHTKTVVLEPGPSTTMTIFLRVQQGTGTAWFDNVVCRRVQSSPMVNIVRTQELPFEVKSPNGVTLYAEGTDYALLPGDELAYPFEETVKPWRIQRLPDGRIKFGGKVSVSYHNAPRATTGTYCPSEPRTQALMKRAIQQTVEVLRPRFVHIGHDESRRINSDDRCRRRGMKAYEIFADDVRRLYDYARAVDPDVKLMMWADALASDRTLHGVKEGMIDVAHRFNEECTIEQMAELIPTDIIMNCWRYYTYRPGSTVEARIDELHEFLTTRAKAGYAVTGSPWYGIVNTYCWGKATQRMRRESDRPLGIYLTTWAHHWVMLPLASNLMWTLDSPSHEAVEHASELERRLTEWIGQFPLETSTR